MPWAIALGVGWPLAERIASWLEPAPAHPDSHTPFVVEVGAAAFFFALVATVTLAVLRERHAGTAGIVAGGVLGAFAFACPLSGHHAWGLWWIGQMAVVAVMLVVSVAALRSTSSHRQVTISTTSPSDSS